MIDRQLLRVLLWSLGIGLKLACRLSVSFRRQVTRDVTIEVRSADGVAHHYAFTPRRVASHSGVATEAHLAITFANARQGIVALASPKAIGKIVCALLEGGAEYRGNGVLVLWFFALTRYVLPIGRTGPLKTPLPDAYLAHDPAGKAAKWITVEPEATELDPAWRDAHIQRAKMVMVRGSAGEKVAMW